MSVGLTVPDRLLAIAGVALSTARSGERYSDRDDLVLVELEQGATVAGVFTQNSFCAAPVRVCRQNLLTGNIRALLINAGNANAGTGEQGMINAQLSCAIVGQKLGVEPVQVLPFSTGVIGEQLNMQALESGIQNILVNNDTDNWLNAAKAIMTTDTVAKGVSRQVEIDGHTITITGIVKGSGMICPDMATLLSFVATDAAIDGATLKLILERVTESSFNRITVDSDTSTNDSLVLMASGKSGLDQIISLQQPQAELLCVAIEQVMVALATAVIRDAEGATKFVKIEVCGGANRKQCEDIAYNVAHSPLVKTALFASDPNWGRLLMAIGKLKYKSEPQAETLNVDTINLAINGLELLRDGEPAPDYTEQAGQKVFSQDEICITIDLGLGNADYHVWTSDLSHDYVSINADYRS